MSRITCSMLTAYALGPSLFPCPWEIIIVQFRLLFTSLVSILKLFNQNCFDLRLSVSQELKWEWKRGNKKECRKRKIKQMRKDTEKEKGERKTSSWWSCPKTRRPLSVRAEASPPYQPRCSPFINESSLLPFLSTSSQSSIDYHTAVLLLSFLSLWLVWSSLQEHNNRISCEDDVDDDGIGSESDISE